MFAAHSRDPRLRRRSGGPGGARGGAVMSKQDDGLMWMVAGGLGSLVLAVLLVPLRTPTPASRLASVCLAFSLVVAELGGRSAAIVRAPVSGMSLHFLPHGT